MSELEALLLGIVQGLTEFLPISSSGHLILVPWLQDYTFLEEHDSFNQTFDVALHAGTLVAAISYFRQEVVAFTSPSSARCGSARSRPSTSASPGRSRSAPSPR
jgi:undecaprenyl-diphosphatase